MLHIAVAFGKSVETRERDYGSEFNWISHRCTASGFDVARTETCLREICYWCRCACAQFEKERKFTVGASWHAFGGKLIIAAAPPEGGRKEIIELPLPLGLFPFRPAHYNQNSKLENTGRSFAPRLSTLKGINFALRGLWASDIAWMVYCVCVYVGVA